MESTAMHQSCRNNDDDCDFLPESAHPPLEHSSTIRNGSKSSTRNRILRWSYITATGVLFLSCLLRPLDVKTYRRNIPRGQRSISIKWSRFSSSFQKAFDKRVQNTVRHLYYQDEQNDKKENNGDDQVQENDQKVDDQVYYYKADTDDAYYNKSDDAYYYYYPPVDDFYLYIDDTIEERLLFPMTVSDLAGMVCTALSIILSVGGGIGPGAILVAVNIIVMDFPPKVAIPLSIVTNLGVSTVGSIMNAKRKHPLSNRPIIDWDLVLIMEPVILLGAIIGTYMNKVIQGKVIIVLLVLLLSVIAHSTLKKARRMHHAEELYIKRVQWAKQKKMNQQSNPEAPVYPSSYENKLEEADPPFLPKIHSISSSATQEINFLNDREANMKREDDGSQSSFSRSFNRFIVLRKEDADSVKSSLIEEEAEYLPQNKISYIIAMFIFVIGMNTLKGGAAFESPFGIYCGSIGFWFFEFLNACWLIGCSFLAGRYLLRRHAIKEAVGYDYVRGDIRWDFKNIVIYPLSCIFFGILSGMFGVGVSVFLAPWLVGIGVNPAVASATCLCLNWFTALASTSSYVVLGSIIPDREYAYMLFVLGVVSSFLGRKLVNRGKSTTKIENNKRLERHSYMAYSMGVVVFISALSMTVEALVDVMNHSFEQDEFDGICEVERYFSY